jgi:hypothetical protein
MASDRERLFLGKKMTIRINQRIYKLQEKNKEVFIWKKANYFANPISENEPTIFRFAIDSTNKTLTVSCGFKVDARNFINFSLKEI